MKTKTLQEGGQVFPFGEGQLLKRHGRGGLQQSQDHKACQKAGFRIASGGYIRVRILSRGLQVEILIISMT